MKDFTENLGISESSIKNIIKEKLGEYLSLNIDKIQISEFNTRCDFLDETHVQTLIKSIEKNGYIPKSAVWVNAITGNDKKDIINYRLVAGRHRYEATKRIGLKEIPTQLYYNLTDEEECALDIIDNELDEHHKPANFLQISEHYKYLRDTKEWSQRQIAKAKNVSRRMVQWRLQIADLSEEVKTIIKNDTGRSFYEKYFRDICKLNIPAHQILICNEIITSSQKMEEDNDTKIPKKIMTQSDIKERVEKLLELENAGRIAKRALIYINRSKSDIDLSLICSPEEFEENLWKNDELKKEQEEEPENYSFNTDKQKDWTDIEKDNKISTQKDFMEKNYETTIISPKQLEFEIFSELSDYRKYDGLRFSVIPMWLKHTNLINEIFSSAYHLMIELISYDFRYQPKKDGFFFIKHGSTYKNCIEFLAHIAGVKVKTLEKKVLPALMNYVNYTKAEDKLKFQLKWDKIYEVYKKNAKKIPFDDGGLENIPSNHTGWIRPTPYHSIYIEKGIIKKFREVNQNSKEEKISEIENLEEQKFCNGKKNNLISSSETSLNKNNENQLKKKLVETGMLEDKIKFCLKEKETTEDVIKYIDEMSSDDKNKIKNKAAYIYKLVKDGFLAPEGFKSNKNIEEQKSRKLTIEEFGEKIKFNFESKKIYYFSPRKDLKYPLSLIPNNMTFLYRKSSSGIPIAGHFSEWLDEKFFI